MSSSISVPLDDEIDVGFLMTDKKPAGKESKQTLHEVLNRPYTGLATSMGTNSPVVGHNAVLKQIAKT